MEKHRKALFLTVLSLFVFDLLGTAAMAADSVRVTTSFDAKYAGGVLRQVSKLFGSGFGQSDAARVEQDINALRPDQPKVWQFKVQYHGQAESLEIRALMDDLGMIDLDFAASPDAAPAVRSAVDGYLNGRGG
jgi:hypothetical protein